MGNIFDVSAKANKIGNDVSKITALVTEMLERNQEKFDKIVEDTRMSTENINYISAILKKDLPEITNNVNKTAEKLPEVTENLNKTKDGKWRGHLEDPYFGITRYYLPALYYDAKLAFEKGHYLPENHRYVLSLNGEDEITLIQHNQRWVNKFENEYIEGENKEGAEHWRLNCRLLIRNEGKERALTALPENLQRHGKKIYKELDQSYYQQYWYNLHDM